MEFDNNAGEPVAYIVENDILINAVEKQLKNFSNVTVMNGMGVEQYKLPRDSSEGVELLMTNGDSISCNLLVSAGNNWHKRMYLL